MSKSKCEACNDTGKDQLDMLPCMKCVLGDPVALFSAGDALAKALETEMDGGGGLAASSRETLAAWRALMGTETER